MKIAITGASSTRRTTLADALLRDKDLELLINKHSSIDPLKILQDNNFSSIDSMSIEQLRKFQLEYLDLKVENERISENFITDNSFIDIASYWLTREAKDQSLQVQYDMVNRCIKFATKYDLHIYIPYESIKFENDDYKLKDKEFYIEYDYVIVGLLELYEIPYIKIDQSELSKKIKFLKSVFLANQV